MDGIGPIIKIAGVAISAKVGEEVCNHLGAEALVPLINLVGWFLSGWIALDFVMNAIYQVKGMF